MTGALESSNDIFHKLNVEYRGSQLNVSKISRTIVAIETVSGTQLAIIQHTHAGIKEATCDAAVSLI